MRKNMAKGMAALLSAALLVTTVGVTPGTTASAASKELSGAVKKATIYKGGPAAKKTVTLKVKKNGKNVTKKCTWTSSKKAVATVNKSGKVTAKKAGNTVISAKYAGKTYKCNVKVKKYRYATALSNLPKSVVELKKPGDTKELRVKYADSKPTTKGVKYASSDESVATVTKSGTITARGEGTATITITTKKNVAKKTITETVEVKVGGQETAASAEPTKGAEATPTAEPTVDPSQKPVVTDVNRVEAMLTNSIRKDSETVLAGQDGTLQIRVTDSNGKPVEGDNVILKLEPNQHPLGANTRTAIWSKTDQGYTMRNVYVNEDMLSYVSGSNGGSRVATTNKDGIATFVLTPDITHDPEGGKIEATDWRYVASYDYTVTDASFNKSTKGVFNVAALTFRSTTYRDDNKKVKYEKNVGVLNNKSGDYKNNKIVPGINTRPEAQSGRGTEDAGVVVTRNVAGERTDYVSSQQVSPTGTKNNAVYFGSNVYLQMPGHGTDLNKMTNHEQTEGVKDVKDGSYGNYYSYPDSETGVPKSTKYVTYDLEDLSNVEYATLKFASLKLSKYTQLDVYTVPEGATKLSQWTYIKSYGSASGIVNEGEFGMQIGYDQLKGTTKIALVLRSEGQVRTDNKINDGYVLKSLIYHFGTSSVTRPEAELLEGATIKWAAADATWTAEKDIYDKNQKVDNSLNLTNEERAVRDYIHQISVKITAQDAGLGNTNEWNTYDRITYKVPAFPYTGNAIIKCYNGNNVVRYYSCATSNVGNVYEYSGTDKDGKKDVTVDGDWTRNRVVNMNILDPYDGSDIYLISTKEASKAEKATVTEVKNGVVEVNSEEAGYTFVKGTVECSNADLKLDDDHASVYTSVMWNPIRNEITDRKRLVALKGQTIKMTAQLQDRNGNPVDIANREIKVDFSANSGATATVDPATRMKLTDTKGQAVFTFKGTENMDFFASVTAYDPLKQYDVVWALADGTKSAIVDLYWIDARLVWTNQVQLAQTNVYSDAVKADGVTKNNTTRVAFANGETWEYATRVVPRNSKEFGSTAGSLAGFRVAQFENIYPTVTHEGDKDIYSDAKKAAGVAILTGKDNKSGKVTFTLKGKAAFTNGKVWFQNGGVLVEAAFAGTDETKVDESVILNYNVGEEKLVFKTIDGSILGYKSSVKNGNTTASGADIGTCRSGNDIIAYVKVTNNYTNAAVKGAVVTFTVGAKEDAKLAASGDGNNGTCMSVAADGKSAKVQTNNEGIASIKITATKTPAVNATVAATLSAEVTAKNEENEDVKGSGVVGNYVFTNAKKGFIFDLEKTTYDETSVTVVFSKNVVASSVTKEQFRVGKKDGKDLTAGTAEEYDIKSIEVKDNTVKLLLNNRIINTNMNKDDVVFVEYKDIPKANKAGDSAVVANKPEKEGVVWNGSDRDFYMAHQEDMDCIPYSIRSVDGEELKHTVVTIGAGNVKKIYNADTTDELTNWTGKSLLFWKNKPDNADSADLDYTKIGDVTQARKQYTDTKADTNPELFALLEKEYNRLVAAEKKTAITEKDVKADALALKGKFNALTLGTALDVSKDTETGFTKGSVVTLGTLATNSDAVKIDGTKVTFAAAGSATPNRTNGFAVKVAGKDGSYPQYFAVIAEADDDGFVFKKVVEVGTTGTFKTHLTNLSKDVNTTEDDFDVVDHVYNDGTCGLRKADNGTAGKAISTAKIEVATAIINKDLGNGAYISRTTANGIRNGGALTGLNTVDTLDAGEAFIKTALPAEITMSKWTYKSGSCVDKEQMEQGKLVITKDGYSSTCEFTISADSGVDGENVDVKKVIFTATYNSDKDTVSMTVQ